MKAQPGLWSAWRRGSPHSAGAACFAVGVGGVPGAQVVASNPSTVRQLATAKSYYDAVIASIRDAESILIFGPGEAKGELKKRLERNNLGGRIVSVMTVDKMTDRQIAAKVRLLFPK